MAQHLIDYQITRGGICIISAIPQPLVSFVCCLLYWRLLIRPPYYKRLIGNQLPTLLKLAYPLKRMSTNLC